ncbi:hypothetical protein KM043_002672 [Ampulex compressa]|nr:hypothetical protein KM043_002672 [Ampulex compressa]
MGEGEKKRPRRSDKLSGSFDEWPWGLSFRAGSRAPSRLVEERYFSKGDKYTAQPAGRRGGGGLFKEPGGSAVRLLSGTSSPLPPAGSDAPSPIYYSPERTAGSIEIFSRVIRKRKRTDSRWRASFRGRSCVYD